MLKDQTTQPTLFQEDSRANPLVLQEKEKEQMTIDTYGMKLLESSKNLNLDGLLGKMLRGLLTSTTAWYSDRCKLIWKKRVSKSNVLLFQLQASVLGIKEKEFGSSDVMFPTPTPSCEKGGEQFHQEHNAKKLGGRLNPNFVEFLMGYPMNWTKIEQTELNHLETQSYPKSHTKLEKQLLNQRKMFRTPTAMDLSKDSFVYAAKILKGKINRSSNSRVQITLSTDVAIEHLKSNPHLIDKYDKPFKIRPNLPNKLDFILYLKSNTTIKKLSTNTDIPKTTIEHWFRKDNCFSYPSIQDWNKIKPHLKTIKFNDELTYEINEDWKS